MLAARGSLGDAMKLLDHCVPGLEARAEHDTLAAALYWRAFCAVGKGRLGPQRRDAERSLALAGARRATAVWKSWRCACSALPWMRQVP